MSIIEKICHLDIQLILLLMVKNVYGYGQIIKTLDRKRISMGLIIL